MTIPPSGALAAPLLVVGRDWGWEEQRAQRQFVGASGKLVTQGMAAAGLNRETDACILNVVEAQPPANDWSGHTTEVIARGAERVATVCAKHPRSLVVALGEQAAIAAAGQIPARAIADVSAQFRNLFGDSITNVRGYVYADVGPVPILVMCHPAFVLRNWHPWWATSLWDWRKAARLAQTGYRTPNVAWDLVERVASMWGLRAPAIAVDIETSGTGCIAFASSADRAIVFAGKPAPDHPNADAICRILANPVPKVFQNGQFDVTMLERSGWQVRNWHYDTMVMWHALEPLLAGTQKDDSASGRKKAGGKRTEKGLRFLGSLLTDFPHWKNYAFETDEQQFELCARDAAVTWACWQTLRARLAA